MNIGLIDVDGKMPNLALMKISAWHKKQGDSVEWYNGLCKYDKVYMSKVFTFTEDYRYYIKADIVEKGGTGYDFLKELPKDVITGRKNGKNAFPILVWKHLINRFSISTAKPNREVIYYKQFKPDEYRINRC